MVAVVVADELQVTNKARFCVLPSLKVPVAVNWAGLSSSRIVEPLQQTNSIARGG
jgi:hypothetical protein